MADLSDTIESVAGEPASASAGGRSAQNHPLPDLIKADEYLKKKEALAGSNALGGRRSLWNATSPAQAIPPGGV